MTVLEQGTRFACSVNGCAAIYSSERGYLWAAVLAHRDGWQIVTFSDGGLISRAPYLCPTHNAEHIN